MNYFHKKIKEWLKEAWFKPDRMIEQHNDFFSAEVEFTTLVEVSREKVANEVVPREPITEQDLADELEQEVAELETTMELGEEAAAAVLFGGK